MAAAFLFGCQLPNEDFAQGVGEARAVFTGALAAFARLCMWPLLQPVVYLLALGIYWAQLGAWSHWLGGLGQP